MMGGGSSVAVLVGMGAAVLAIAAPASAATFGVKAHERLVLAVNPNTAYYDLRNDTGWQTAGSAQIDLTQSTTGDGGATLSGDMHSRAAYGDLRAWGSGSVTNSWASGAFQWQTSYIGGEPNAAYTDRITITSSTLPAHTPVSITFGVNLAGYMNALASSPGYVSASVTGEVSVASSSFSKTLSVSLPSNQSPSPAQFVTLLAGVGDVIDIRGKLWTSIDASSNSVWWVATQSFDYNAQIRTAISVAPAGTSLMPQMYSTSSLGSSSEPQVSYMADSGTTYAAVPEPTSLGVMAVSAIGLLRRRRR